MKWLFSILCPWILIAAALAQQKPIPQRYVTDVLDARTVAVVTSQAEPAEDPQENERARRDTEQALLKWGKYQVTGDPAHADLIVLVRKGRAHSSTINTGGPPGTIMYPNPNDSGITIGTRHGQTPPLSRTDPPPGQPRMGQQVGSADDRLEVYLGGTPRIGDATRNKTEYPLDEPPIWSYTEAHGLKAPQMDAVTQFQKAVEAAQKKHP